MLTQIIDLNSKKVGELELKDEIFAAPVHQGLLYNSVLKQLANKRLGTAKTKTRSEVKCTNRKPYRQKGTGRARHGSYASPIFVGGGVTFGPKPRSYEFNMPKKARRLALKSAISLKFKEGKALVVDKIEIKKTSTKNAKEILKKLNANSALLVTDTKDENVLRSFRNIANVKVLGPSWLNIYDVLRYEHLIFTAPAIKSVQEVLKA